jgi:3-hydroxybutyryl-CoA dehydrogenase
MGAGIAQLALEAGNPVAVHDPLPDATARAMDRIRDGLARRAAKLDLDADAIDEWVDGRLAGLRVVSTVEDAAADAALVIEAVTEDLAVKSAIFATLDAVARDDAILATNTSALSVTAIAHATDRPERVLGLHFFNPAPVLALVEVVLTPQTDPSVADRASALVTGWGKTAVRCRDSPGFIVNRVNRPFTIEALRMVERGEAAVGDIDRAIRGVGFPSGPFELMDLVGLDVNLAAATGVWDGLGRPERLRPSPIQVELVADGRLGRKTGLGFYRYAEATPPAVAPPFRDGSSTLADAAIVTRIRDAIDRERTQAIDEGVATAEDIDLALRLGAGHPSR